MAAGGAARLEAAGVAVRCRRAGRRGGRRPAAGVAAQATHRAAAPDLEIRQQRRRAQRRLPTAPVSGSPVRPRALDLHRRRAAADAIVVGTGTVLADDPALTARLPDGSLADRQPLRVVVGMREIPSEAKVLNDDSRTMADPHPRSRWRCSRPLSDRTDVLLEGGPTLAGAFLRAGVVNRILAYVAPILLGGPVTAVDDVGVTSIAQALRWQFDGIDRVGPGSGAQPGAAQRLALQRSTERRPAPRGLPAPRHVLCARRSAGPAARPPCRSRR